MKYDRLEKFKTVAQVLTLWFDSLKEAENHHAILLKKYDYVRCNKWPEFSERGYYQWTVS